MTAVLFLFITKKVNFTLLICFVSDADLADFALHNELDLVLQQPQCILNIRNK